MRVLRFAAVVVVAATGLVVLGSAQNVPTDADYLCATGVTCPKLPSQFMPSIPHADPGPPPTPVKMPVLTPPPAPKIVKSEPFAPVVAPPPTTIVIQPPAPSPPDALDLEREQQEYKAQQQAGWALGYAVGMGIRKMVRHHKISTYCRKNPMSGECPAWIDKHPLSGRGIPKLNFHRLVLAAALCSWQDAKSYQMDGKPYSCAALQEYLAH